MPAHLYAPSRAVKRLRRVVQPASARKLAALAVGLVLLLAGLAERSPAAQGQSLALYDVFLEAEDAATTLYFVDVQTGLSSIVAANGQRHLVLQDSVLYEAASGATQVAYPDGRIGIYAAIPPVADDVRVAWVATADGQRLAWSVTQRHPTTVFSDLYVAAADGTGTELVFHTSSTQGFGLVPLALMESGDLVYYARQAALFESPSGLFVAAFEDVFRLDTRSGVSDLLPATEGCPCPTAIAQDGHRALRLVANGRGGYDAQVTELYFGAAGGASPPAVQRVIPAPDGTFSDAHNLLLSPEGDLALYTVAQGDRYALILVDAVAGAQRVAIGRLRSALQPITFLAENGGVLLVREPRFGNGTFKLWLADGTLIQVSGYTYLGQIRQG